MRIKKTAIAMMVFSAIAMVVGVNFAGAQVYTPLVQIPGLPPTGAVNLSMYLVGLYDFLLSIVGIVAVMMLIIGGMRYITAAGNQAAVSDAKDIITNALAGLLLAILSWVIVAEINPDVLYIKKPGAGFSSADGVNWGACGQYDPSLPLPSITNCTCKDGFIMGSTSHELCDRDCRLQEHCMIEGAQCFIREDINGPHFYALSDNEVLGQDGECYCIDGEKVAPVGGADCETTCETANCLVADARMRVYSDAEATNLTATQMFEMANRDGTKENPYLFPDTTTCNFAFEGENFSSFFNTPVTYDWDWSGNGAYDGWNTSGWGICWTYAAAVAAAPPICYDLASPEAYVCKMMFKITDSTGAFKEDVLYYGWIKP